MTQKHTPLPWVLPEQYDTIGAAMGEIPIRSSNEPDSIVICSTKHKENRRVLNPNFVADAAFIVKACNRDHHFDALVEALKDTVRILEAVKFTAGLGKNQFGRLEKAKAALAAVEGK